MKDIKYLRTKKEINTYNDIPILPSQVLVLKDLILLFDICDQRTVMSLEDFLEPSGNGGGRTRYSNYTSIEKAINNRSEHHQTRSIFRRHRYLLHWMGGLWDFAQIAGLKKDARKKTLEEILGKLDTEENQLRLQIYNGSYTYIQRPSPNRKQTGSNSTIT